MGFKPITVGLSIDDSLFKDMHLVAKDPLKLNNAINTCLINLNIYIMLFKYTLNIYEDHRHISIIYNHFHNILYFLMFYQIFLSPQVEGCAIITYKHGIYELPHKLPNDLG